MLLPLWTTGEFELEEPVIVNLDGIRFYHLQDNYVLSSSDSDTEKRLFVNMVRGPGLVEIYDREERLFIRRTISDDQGYWRIDSLQPGVEYNIHAISITGPYRDDFIGSVIPVFKPEGE